MTMFGGDSAGSRLLARRQLRRLLRNAIFRALVCAELITLVIALVRYSGWLQPLELSVYDALRVGWAGSESNDRITLIGITESDIERWGTPFVDDVLVEVLERILAAKPRVVGVDLFRNPIGTELHRRGLVPPDSGKFSALLKAHPEIVWVFKLPEGEAHPKIPAPAPLADTERAVLADVATDPGDVVRRGLLYADDGTQNYAGLGTAVALAYLAQDRIAPEAESDALRLGKAVIWPLDSDRGPYFTLDARGYQMLLDYHGGAQPFPRRSVTELMDGDLSNLIRDRAVLLGDTSDSVKDFFATPFNIGFHGADRVYGMEIHAHLADQLIRLAKGEASVLGALSRMRENLWIWLWAISATGLGLLVRSTLPTVLLAGAGIIAIAGTVYLAFGQGLLLPALPAALAWLGCLFLTNQLLYAATHRARARLRQSFEHYLPPSIIADMVRSEELPKLGGERREISVLFTDVAGFTTFSESVEPETLADITNEYLEGVCDAIFRHGGLVNSFIGDGVLAIFGAPQSQPDHADRAIAAALDIDRFGQHFSAEQTKRGYDFGHTRIGVHTGQAFVGNVGARQRLQYTALGDVLNTASRLEGLNKAIGTRIAVSGDIVKKLLKHRCRPVGAFIVKGRHGATQVYEPVDPQRYPAEWIERYEEAYHALEKHEPCAARQFQALHQENRSDPCINFHVQRLERGEADTVIEMHEK